MEVWQILGLGAAGGVLPDFLKAVRKRFQERPEYLGRPWYWASLAMLAVLGAVASYLGKPTDWSAALAFGAAAPAFLTSVLGLEKDDHLGTDDDEPGFLKRVRIWWGS